MIRREQMELLEKEWNDHLMHRSLLNIKENFPRQVQNFEDESLELLIRKRISKAKTLEIDDDDEILRFINLVFLIGYDYEKKTSYDWIFGILEKIHIPDTSRMTQVYEMLKSGPVNHSIKNG